jgi:hypothetical protein
MYMQRHYYGYYDINVSIKYYDDCALLRRNDQRVSGISPKFVVRVNIFCVTNEIW